MADGFSAQEFIDRVMAGQDIRSQFFISYGAMNSVFSFLWPVEVLSYQAANRFMYYRGVERL